MPRDPRHYDQQYFDRWYRDPEHRVFTAAERARRVAVVISVAEYVLGRRVRSVLDVGAGEGHWRAPLIEARPRIEYVGLDPSPYVVARFGRTRGIELGDLETLDPDRFARSFDIVLAVGFLNLIPAKQLAPALRRLRPLIGGLAFISMPRNHLPAILGFWSRGSSRSECPCFGRGADIHIVTFVVTSLI
jgi:SAM-dependent methyltransferase